MTASLMQRFPVALALMLQQPYYFRTKSRLLLLPLPLPRRSFEKAARHGRLGGGRQGQHKRGYCASFAKRSGGASSSTASSAFASSVPTRVQDMLSHNIVPRVLLDLESEEETLHNASRRTILLLVYVSGGCDSVALLDAIVKATRQQDKEQSQQKYHQHPQYQIHVVHFDHQQRGADSTGDCQFVQDLAHQYQLPCHCYLWSDYYSSSSKAFSQDAARQWRRSTGHQLVQQLLSNSNSPAAAAILLTAHHVDDSNETLLLKVLRGAHLTNLQGMSVVTRVTEPQENNNAAAAVYHWARPLLTTTKAEIVDYLTHTCQRTWRQDASNASDKYRRNRVRNELLPLLADLAGGPAALQRRLDSLQEQSRELYEDVTVRAQAYLDEKADGGNEVVFHLPGNPGALGVVHKQALYMWVQTGCDQHVLSYDQLERLCTQLREFPDRRQWRFNIGNGWDVVRQGEALRLTNTSPDGGETGESLAKREQEQTLEWALGSDGDTAEASDGTTLRIRLSPRHVSGSTRFLLLTIASRQQQGRQDVITPPWRKGRSPVAVTEFLRGQKVPLHERNQAPVVLLQSALDEESCTPQAVVAVYVASKDAWIVDARFAGESAAATTENENDGSLPICIQLVP